MRKLVLVLGAVAIIAVGLFVFVVAPSDDNGSTRSATRFRAAESTAPKTTSWRLELAGADIGAVKVVGPVGKTANVTSGAGGTKAQGSVLLPNIVLDVNAQQLFRMLSWVDDALKGRSGLRNGALVGFGSAPGPLSRLNFQNGAVVGLQTTCDPASTAPPVFRLTIKVGQLTPAPPTGSIGPANTTPAITQIRCRLVIPSFDATKVSKIEGVGFTIPTNTVGAGQSASMIAVSDLRVSFADAGAKPWQDWFAGNSGGAMEKNMTLEFLAPQGENAVLRIELRQCGPFKSEFGVVDTTTTHIAELYCEQLPEIRF